MAKRRLLLGYVWSCTAVFCTAFAEHVAASHLSAGQSSLLDLLVVLGAAIVHGIGPAVAAALLSFVFWTQLHVPAARPVDMLHLRASIDWLTLCIYLLAAVAAGRLSSWAREQTLRSRERESEISLLFEASEAISHEVDTAGAVGALSTMLRSLCRAPKCLVWRSREGRPLRLICGQAGEKDEVNESIYRLACAAAEHKTVIGFDRSGAALWRKAAFGASLREHGQVDDAYIPLRTDRGLMGVLYVAARQDHRPFSRLDQRLIMTLANHLAFVIERDALFEEAAQAAALRESDILKDSILSMVSHELRSPLAAIKATASAAQIETGESESLNAIMLQTDKLSEIVNNLLDLSRLEAGAWMPELDWCDVAEVMGTVLDRLAPADAARVRLRCVGDLPLIQIDYIQIALAVTNLLNNAAKYAPPGTPIDLTLSPEHNGSEERCSGIAIRVRDYGGGIGPHDLDRIFERFFRSRPHRRIGIAGTGLGLALVKAIVTGHNGRVWAANAPAGEEPGALFTIVLPVE